MFDIVKDDFSKSADTGYSFELKLPDGTPSGAKLTIRGDMSPAVVGFTRKKVQEYLQKQAAAKRKNKDESIDFDEMEENKVESALLRLLGWSGITEEGKEVQFSKEKATEVLTKHNWICDQILEQSADVENFTPRASKT